jgi:hypothetical protein
MFTRSHGHAATQPYLKGPSLGTPTGLRARSPHRAWRSKGKLRREIHDGRHIPLHLSTDTRGGHGHADRGRTRRLGGAVAAVHRIWRSNRMPDTRQRPNHNRTNGFRLQGFVLLRTVLRVRPSSRSAVGVWRPRPACRCRNRGRSSSSCKKLARIKTSHTSRPSSSSNTSPTCSSSDCCSAMCGVTTRDGDQWTWVFTLGMSRLRVILSGSRIRSPRLRRRRGGRFRRFSVMARSSRPRGRRDTPPGAEATPR